MRSRPMASNREKLALLLERERRRAKGDLFTFARWMFARRKGYAWQQAAHHPLICAALMRVFRGECRRLIINVPPRYSKTELAVVNFVAWALGHVPDAEFIHASYSGVLAGNNSSNARELVEHDEYRLIFDTRIATDAKAHWTTTEGGVMYATGAGGTITGFGAGKHRPGFGGAIIIDDPHKADEAASDKIRQGVIDWFQTTLESRKNSPETPIIVIMQRLHEKDLAGWLLGDRGKDGKGPAVAGGNGEVWEHLCLSAVQDDGTPLWPEKHTAADLARMEKAAPYVFAGQYRQRPSPPTGGLFKPDLMPIVQALPANVVQWCRGWDLGATEGGDFTAGVKVGQLADGRYVVADVKREQMETHARDALIKNTADGDGRGRVKQSIPQDPGQAGKGQVAAFAKLLAGHNVHFSPETGEKTVRATPFASQVNVGNVLLLAGAWNDPFKDELRVFPFGTYDDQVDGASRAFNGLLGPTAGVFT
jgi:predicted phage terminase large subunit-like protein